MRDEKARELKDKLRVIRVLLSDIKRVNHQESQKAIYISALNIANQYFNGNFCTVPSYCDVLEWRNAIGDRMDSHPIPKLKGI